MEDHNKQQEWIAQAIEQRKGGKYEEAKGSLEKAVELGSQGHLAQAYYNLGVLYEQSIKDVQRAVENYEKAVEIKPDYSMAWNNLGHVFLSQGALKESLNALNQGLIADSNDPFLLLNKGCVLNRNGQFEEALDTLASALEQEDKLEDEKRALLYSEIGLCLVQSNQPEQALDPLMEAYSLNPNELQTTYNLGFVHDALGRYDEALNYYDKALELKSPDASLYFKAHQGKACVYIHTKKFNDALPWIKKAIELSPANFEPYYNLACIQVGLKDYEGAVESLKRTIDLAPVQIGIAQHIQNDPDFLALRGAEAFEALMD